MKFNLDRRLSTAAGYVSEGGILADIGTDHAKLPVSLLSDGKISGAYACDINEGPIAAARALISEKGFGNEIKTVVTNGLCGLPLSEITDVSICGMGGELISGILSASLCEEYCRINFILNPMSRDDELRKYLLGAGFSIISEKAVCQSGKVYTVMNAAYTGGVKGGKPEACRADFTDREYLLSGGFTGETEEERAYLKKIIARLKKEKLGAADEAEAEDISGIIKNLERRLLK